jgi:hypothetical protein
VAITDPYRPSSNEFEYSFSGSWSDEEGTVYESIDDIILVSDMKFYPIYTSE